MTDRFKNAVDALVNAYLNDTLYRNDCASCAVGNIVNAAHGIETPKAEAINVLIRGKDYFMLSITNSMIGRTGMSVDATWYPMISMLYNDRDEPRIHHCALSNESKKVNEKAFLPTGYSYQEMAEVESVFMNATVKNFFPSREKLDQTYFNALMAVVDLLISWEDQDIDIKEIEARFLAKV